MIRRFRLEQKGRYEKLVIAQRLSDMLDKFLDGRPAPLGIGAEQGGIAEWDDVVIYHSDDHWEHLQIKRQTSGFSEKHLDKADYLASYKPRKKAQTTKTAEEEPKVPSDEEFDSELEKVLKSLAAWQPPAFGEKPSKRTFSLTLPGPEVVIKGKGKEIIKITHLREVWDLCRKDGVDISRLSGREEDKPTQYVYTWLTTWCGFKDWAHIVEKMRMLEIHCIGDEGALEARALDSLHRHFSDSTITLSVLLDYIGDSTTDTNAVTCHTTAKHLQKLLRPDGQTWTQYLINPIPGQGWTVAGTHDLGCTTTVLPRSPAAQIVSHHWAESIPNRRLRLHAEYARPTRALTLPSAILRLALHLKKGSESMFLGETEGINGKHALRIGPRTVKLLEDAIIMLLLTCVGLGGGHWRSIEPIGDVLSIALRHWSGEPADNDGPRRLGDDNLRKLLGQSPPPVVILSGVEESATELLQAGMAEDLEAGHSMAAGVS